MLRHPAVDLAVDLAGWPVAAGAREHDRVATDPPVPPAVRAGARTTQRRGRMSPAKRAALARLAERWTLPADGPWTGAALDTAFGRAAPRLLDIGAGNGAASRAWALEHPDHDVVAVELHQPGILRLVQDLEASGPASVRAVEVDVLDLLAAAGPGAVGHVRVLFPDPWPKRRHVGRRLVDPPFVRLVTDLLPVGGTLHVATDWADYADQIGAALRTDARLIVDTAGSVRPPRPVTAYEQRGLDAGREINDLVARRVR